jgi:hypothetical protein
MNPGAAIVLMCMFVGAFATIFGIFYLKTRQNLAMIEKGMNPRLRIERPTPYRNMRWAMLLIGAGLGLFLAFLLDRHILPQQYNDYNGRLYRDDGANVPIYFALIAVGGGLGLVFSYFLEKKWWDKMYEKEQASFPQTRVEDASEVL